MSFIEADPWVSLVPRDAGWVASFYPASKGISIYVDLTTPAVWSPAHVIGLDAGWCPRVLGAVADGVEPFAGPGHERLRQAVGRQR